MSKLYIGKSKFILVPDIISDIRQARTQEFPEGGSLTRVASRAPREARCSYGRGYGGRTRPPEALGYLEQNPEM